MTMRALVLPHDQIDNHGRDGASSLRVGGMGCRGYRPGRQSGMHRRVSSSLAARQVSQLGRGFGLGRFFATTGDVLEFEALRRAGLSASVALANLSQAAAHFAVQANAELLPIVHVPASKDAVRYVPTRSENGFADAEHSFAPGAKAHD